jgi:hypothetical protein
MNNEERIIKVEHIAETLVCDFFKVFLSKDTKIRAYRPLSLEEDRKEPFQIEPDYFKERLGKEPKVTMQFEVGKFFKVNEAWSKALLKKEGGVITIDDLTCFDCALVGDQKILAIEVKSGKSARYEHINAILKYSYSVRALSVTETDQGNILVGDIISILNGPGVLTKGMQIKDVKLSGCILESRKNPEHNYQLLNEWILVVRSHDHLKKYTHTTDNKISLILTLQDIVDYLRKYGDLNLSPVLNTDNLSLKDRLWNDFLSCLNDISKKADI